MFELSFGGELQPKIPVFVDRERRIESATVVYRAASKQDGVYGHEIVAAKHGESKLFCKKLVKQRAVFRRLLSAAVDCDAVGPREKFGEESGEMIFANPVIVVEEERKVSGCGVQPYIAGRRPVVLFAIAKHFLTGCCGN